MYCTSDLHNRILAAQGCFLPYLLLATHSEAVGRQEDPKAQLVMLQLFAFSSPPSEEERIPLKISFTQGAQIPSKLIIPIPDSFIETSFSEPLDDLDEELPENERVTKLDVFVKALSMHEHLLTEHRANDCEACKDRYFAQIIAGEWLLESPNRDLSLLFLSCVTKSAESLNLTADSETINATQKRELKRLKIGSPSASRCTSVTLRRTPWLWKAGVMRSLFNQSTSSTSTPISESPAPDS